MIDQIDAQLKTWVENVLGSVDVVLSPPRDTGGDAVVHLYLMQIVPALAPPDLRRSPVRAHLRYLVAVRAAEPETAHRLLGELIFAALDSAEPGIELDFDPLPAEWWLALGVEPQPAFLLRVPLTRDLPTRDDALVREPMHLQAASIASLHGVVLGSDALPLYGALVELPGLRLSQRTDSRGRFRFPTVPVDPPITRVVVTAKGQAAEIELGGAPVGEPLVIRLPEDA